MEINVNVKIEAPELASAISNLANALSGIGVPILGEPLEAVPVGIEVPKETPDAKPAKTKSKSKTAKEEPKSEPAAKDSTQTGADETPSVPEAAETGEPAPIPEPVATTPNVTLQDIIDRGMRLMDAGKMDEAQKVFTEFGVQRLTEVPEAQYDAFFDRLGELL